MKKIAYLIIIIISVYSNIIPQNNTSRSGKEFTPENTNVKDRLTLSTIFYEDFQDGMPSSFALFNLDGLIPAPLVNYVNNAWVAKEDFVYNVNDTVAFSTSWYIPAGQSNDWMITPAINIGANAVLSWDALAPDPEYADGYEVRISTTTQTTAGCLANPPLFIIASEDSSWTSRSINLVDAGYSNQQIYIAFRNNSTDMFLLCIDDIKVEDIQTVSVDGDLSDPQYNTLAVKLNSNSGFGSAIDVQKILYYPDPISEKLYIGIEGKLDAANNNGIGLFLGFTDVMGTPPGNILGGDPGGHFMGNTGNNNFKAEFEVDYMFALNPGNSSTTVYIDAVGLEGIRTAQYLGSCNQSGTSQNGPESAGLFGQNTLQFAFNNTGTAGKGFEISIPFSELGVNTSSLMQAFTFIVSSTAYFSDVTVPGNITTGNPGFNPDFDTIQGGPFVSEVVPLPVELISFNVIHSEDKIMLTWQTAGETNNKGFNIERGNSDNWETLGFIPGKGTTTEKSTYSFIDNKIISGNKISYRLKQINYDGSFNYSQTVTIDISSNSYYILQNYPNPFNPVTNIEYSLPSDGMISLKIYDVLGNEVAVIVNEYKNAGSYLQKFNAGNLSSGIYIYILEAGEVTLSGKMSLLK